MAEAIGAASAIAGLLTLAAQITKFSYTYLSDLRNASKSQRSYLLEISGLSHVLIQAESILNDDDQDLKAEVGKQIAAVVEECSSQLEDLKKELESRVPKDGGKLRRLQSDLVWPFKEKEIKQHIETIHRFRNLIANAIAINTRSISAGTHQKMETLRLEHERRQLSEWLDCIEPSRSSLVFECAAYPETMGWFLTSTEYLTWRDGSPSLVWCYGRPGVGKSTLSAIITENLQLDNTPQRIVFHYFCDFTERTQQTTATVIKTFLHQALARASGQQLSKLQSLRTKSNAPPRLATLLSALIEICSLHTTFLVLDALDEFEDRRNVYPVLKQFVQAGWRVVVTSRDFPDIREAMHSYSRIEIEARREDVQTYVSQRLDDSDFQSITNRQTVVDAVVEKSGRIFLLARLIMDRLLELTTVKQMRRFLENMPSTVHDGYVSSLDRILALPPNRSALALRLIGWITHAERRLKVQEVLHAFALEEDSEEIDEDNIPTPNMILQVCIGLVSVDTKTSTIGMFHVTAYEFFQSLPQIRDGAHLDIATTSLGYLSLSPSSSPCSDFESLSTRFSNMPFLSYAAQFWGKHARGVEQQILVEIDIFLRDHGHLAASFQALQIGQWSNVALSTAVFASLPSGQEPLHIAAYWGLDNTLTSFLSAGEDPATKDSDGWTPLHWAASNGHGSTATILLSWGVDIDPPDSKGWTPLFWASFRGHTDLVSTLLANDADYQTKDIHGWTALHWAITKKNDAIVRILLHHHQIYSSQSTPIEIPVKTLDLSKAKEIKLWQDRRDSTPREASKPPLEIAAEVEDSDIFDMLLQDFDPANKKATPRTIGILNNWWSSHAFDPPVSNIWRTLTKAERLTITGGRERYLGGAPEGVNWKSRVLQVAIKEEKIHVAEMLLELGADPKVQIGGIEWSALHVATCREDPRFVEAVLRWNEECIPIQDYEGRTALHLAVLHGFENPMRVLLEKGADVNGRDEKGNTPLVLACGSVGWKKRGGSRTLPLRLVQILLEYGADHSLRNLTGDTALHVASNFSTPEVVEVLVAAGADAAVVNGEGLSILGRYITYIKEDNTDTHLLDRLLDLCSWEVGQPTPCFIALSLKSENKNIFKHLQERGMMQKAEFSEEEAGSIAVWAFQDGEIEVFRYILDRGAPFDPKRLRRTPAHLLVDFYSKGGLTLALAFIDALQKAYPQSLNSKEMTEALHFTLLLDQDEEVFQMLINHGADIYAPSNTGEADSFLLAAAHGRWKALSCLLRNHKSQLLPRDPPHWLSSLQPTDIMALADLKSFFVAMQQANLLDCETNGTAFLRLAVRRGDVTAVECLVQAVGGDMEVPDESGWTMLHWAVYRDHGPLVDFLLEHGADVCAKTKAWATDWGRPACIYRGSPWVGHPLHLAAMFGQVSTVEKLLKRGADVNAASLTLAHDEQHHFPGHGPSALHIALQTGGTYSIPGNPLDDSRLRIAQMLVEGGASVISVADHLTVRDVLRFEGQWEDLWDKVRDGVTARGQVTTIYKKK